MALSSQQIDDKMKLFQSLNTNIIHNTEQINDIVARLVNGEVNGATATANYIYSFSLSTIV